VTGGPVSRKRRALTQTLEERGARQERGGGGEYLEEDEHFNIQVQQAVQTMWLEERPTRKSKSAPNKSVRNIKEILLLVRGYVDNYFFLPKACGIYILNIT
jgi:hypothetical protein